MFPGRSPRRQTPSLLWSIARVRDAAKANVQRDLGAGRGRRRRPRTPGGGLRARRRPLRPPPRRRAPEGLRRRRGVHLEVRAAARAPRQGGGLRPAGGVPGGRARHRLLLHHAARRVPRARRARVRLLHLQRRDARAVPAPAVAPRGGGGRVRGDGGRGPRARAAAAAAVRPPEPRDGQDEPELHVVRVPRQALRRVRRHHREHARRARAERARRHRRRAVRARSPCPDGLPDWPGHLVRPAPRPRAAAARVRAVARRAAPGLRGVPLLRQRRVLHRAQGARGCPRPGAQRPPLPLGSARPAGARRAAAVGREPRRAAARWLPREDQGKRHGVADEGAAEGDTGPRRRGGFRHALRLELGPREPVVRRPDGALAALRRAAP
ncbi:hypothetical protein BS78_01G134400 [Paspalum vaginatum]|nr:hypothetical protein BS78_01G134400 [Paspalum vaginatum]